jgi:uncharacterized membrane protein (UPF0127 family)
MDPHMKTRKWYYFFWLLIVFSAAGCGQGTMVTTAAPDDSAAEPSERVLHMDHAQPKLTTLKLYLADKTVTAEVAKSIKEIATGMMFRESMGENEGMLFVFGRPHQTSFYMKNTIVPLSGAYIDSEGKILEIHKMEPHNQAGIPSKKDNIQFVLEMNQGWFEKNGISVGTRVVTERGSLVKTFFGR